MPTPQKICGFGSVGLQDGLRCVHLPMTPDPLQIFWIAFMSLGAGFMGSIVGLGGGIIIIPALTLFWNVPFALAGGASLLAVICTSSAAAPRLVNFTNLRVGCYLLVPALLGTLAGDALSRVLSIKFLHFLFAALMIYSAIMNWWLARKPKQWGTASSHLALRLRLPSSFEEKGVREEYGVDRVPGALLLMLLAGAISNLLGLGSGTLKVPAMDLLMKLPFKVSTATSNFMIGVTALASFGFYAARGNVDLKLCAPVVVGTLLGGKLGSAVVARARVSSLRTYFMMVLLFIAFQMARRGLEL